jgi:hypothetical protein
VKFYDANDAFAWLCRALTRRESSLYQRTPLNHNRHVIIRNQETGETLYALFKREYFITFGRQFPEFARKEPSLAGYAESINEENLDLAIRFGAQRVVFVHPDGRAYSTTPNALRAFCTENGLIRTQNKVNSYIREGVRTGGLQERTYCIPIKLLTREELPEVN